MRRKKKNMASDEPVMFQKRSQNAQPPNEILCSKGAWGMDYCRKAYFSISVWHICYKRMNRYPPRFAMNAAAFCAP